MLHASHPPSHHGRTLQTHAPLTTRSGEAGARGAVVIRVWRNKVFTVDDGEARAMDDPANKAFLAALENG